MAETKSTQNCNANLSYATSFGGMQNKTCYQKVDVKSIISKQPKYEIDLREQMGQQINANLKSLSTTAGGPGTAGYAMVPINVDPRIIDQTRKYTPLVEIIPRVTNIGMYADYNVITAKGGATTYAEGASLSATDTTFDRKSEEIKFLYAIGETTGQANAAMPSWNLGGIAPTGGATGGFNDQNAVNADQLNVLVKTREIRELQERLIIAGDKGSVATEYDGIIQIMGSTNAVDKSSAAMTLADIDIAIQGAFDNGGRPNMAVCSSGVFTDLLGLLTAKIGYMQSTQEVYWGFSTIVLNTMVGQIPVIPSMYMSNTANSKAIYFLDMSVVEMRVLQDLTFEKLAKVKDSQEFMLKIYECFLIKNPSFCASIINIA